MISLEAAEQALLASERRLGDALTALGWCVGGARDLVGLAGLVKRPRARGGIDRSYYEGLHTQLDAYQRNNWLVSEVDSIVLEEPKSVVELGCGNGSFLRAIAPHVESVIGIDWAKSPRLEPLAENASFRQGDLLEDDIPQADLVCSADVLEHFEPDEIPLLIAKAMAAAPLQYHVVACYDDTHSHLTVMPPGAWLATFRKFDGMFQLRRVGIRRDDPEQQICTIANFETGAQSSTTPNKND